MPDKTIDDLAESIRQMKSEIRDLKGQLAINKLGNQTIYQAMANTTLESPTVRGGTSTGGTYTTPSVTNPTISDLTLTDDKIITSGANTITIPDATDTMVGKATTDTLTNKSLTGLTLTDNQITTSTAKTISFPDVTDDLVNKTSGQTLTNKTLTAPVVNTTITLVDGDNNTTISKTTDSDEVVFSNDIVVLTGKFASSTVEIGGQTLSESGQLYISDAVTPGVVIKDTGDTGADAAGTFAFLDSADTNIGYLANIGGDIHLVAGLATKNVIIKAADDIQFFVNSNDYALVITQDKAAHFQSQVNFAAGTTYKITATGNASLKDITCASVAITNKVVESNDYLHLIAAATKPMYLDSGGAFTFRDKDDSNATKLTIASATGDIDTTGFVDAATGFKNNGTAGATGLFVDNNSKNVTVAGGIITNLDAPDP